MEYRQLGSSGIKVSEIALGSWLTYGRSVDERSAADIIHRAYDLGVNYFDTANVYAGGAAEEIVGRALRDLPRDTYLVATKVFFPMGDRPNQSGLSRKHIRDQAEASLRRLGTDYIDIYYAHRYDPQTPLAETLRAFDDLVRAGKVLYIGVSMWSAAQMMEAHAIAEQMNLEKVVVNQPVYNMLDRRIEAEVIPTCQDLGIAQAVYSPLAQGVLTGKYVGGKIPPGSRAADPKREGRFMGPYLQQETLRRVEHLRAIADELGMSMTQMALAFCLRQQNVCCAICGAKRPEQIEENATAAGKSIPQEALQKIDEILS